MTGTDIQYLEVIITIGFFILPTAELITNKERKGLKRITIIGWVCILFAMFSAAVFIEGISINKSDTAIANHVSDSTRKADKKDIINSIENALKPHNLTYNPNTKTVSENQKYREPDIEIDMEQSPNAILRKKNNGEFTFLLALKNKQQGTAKNIQYYATIISDSASNFTQLGRIPSNLSNETVKLEGEKLLTVGLPIYGESIPNYYLIFLKIEYSDSLNITQGIIRKIYSLSDRNLGEQLEEANEYQYTIIKSLLLKNHVW